MLPDIQSQPATRTNWSANYLYSTSTVFEPTTTADVQDAVRSVPNLRALGTRHAFNGIADSTVAQLSTHRLTSVHIDPATRTATIGAGIRYGELALALEAHGLALPNLASLPHISVGGAVATATHGSGLHNGNLATPVLAVEFVAADGTLHTLSRARNPDTFPAAVVALGALGIVTRLTLALEPTYRIAQVVYQNLPFAALEHNLLQIISSAYSVSLFTDWQNARASTVWLKHRLDPAAPPPTLAPAFYQATLATEKLHPIPAHPAQACTDQLNQSGPWYERLPHFKLDFTPSSGQEIQTEYFVPIDRAYEAIRAVETLRDRITPHLLVSELRAVAADDLWLSMAYQRTSLAIHFTWKPDTDAVLAILPALEAALAPFAARPHWAKVFTLDAPGIHPLYPRASDFLALARLYDPKGKFRNAYLESTSPDQRTSPVRGRFSEEAQPNPPIAHQFSETRKTREASNTPRSGARPALGRTCRCSYPAANVRNTPTFLASSPGASTGVSAINTAAANRSSRSSRRNASAPIVPSPICSCRSSLEPIAAFASLQCHTFTASNPTVSRTSSIVSTYPSGDTMSYPATCRWHVSRQTPTGTHFSRQATSSATCSSLPPSENSAPAVFSISTLKSGAPLKSICATARSIDSAASRSPSSRVNPFQLPGCSTRFSAPSASARSTSPRNAAVEFTRTLSVWLHRLIR
jgi:xylitol oxidase